MREEHFYYVKGWRASHPFMAGKVSIIGLFSPIFANLNAVMGLLPNAA